MAVSKALIGLGILCVLAPATLAAMARDDDGYVGRKAAEAMSGLGLINLLGEMQHADEQETAMLSARTASELGSRVSRMLVQHAGLDLTLADEEGGLSEDDPFADAALGGGVAAASGAARQASPRVAEGAQVRGGSSAAGAASTFAGSGGGAGAAVAGGGGGSGVGGSGDGDRVPQLAASDAALPGGSRNVRAEDVLTAVPVPASVWMLLASIAALAIGGHRRRFQLL